MRQALLTAAIMLWASLGLTVQNSDGNEFSASRPTTASSPARTFNSKMKLWVIVCDGKDKSEILETPASEPLVIPAGKDWWVLPLDAEFDMAVLVREVNEKQIPGLELSEQIGNLNISRKVIKDEDLAKLKDLKSLSKLELWGCRKVTDAGLKHLEKQKGLQELNLGDCRQVTDVGLSYLKGLTALRELNLCHTQVTDAGLAHLKELKSLRMLNLSNLNITDAGLIHLKELKGLEVLHLYSTKVTDDGAEELRKTLPKCQIWFW